MSRSQRSCNASASCRLEWRPSRWLTGAILLLGVLAVFSVLASEMPRAWAWPLATLALVYTGWSARRSACQPVQVWYWPGGERPPTVDGEIARDVVVTWRGSLAFVRWRDAQGRIRRRGWWPDTLPMERRRELRLAATTAPVSPRAASVAP